MKLPEGTLVRLIAVFKLLKATLLLVVGVGAFKLLHRDAASTLEHVVSMLGLDPGNRYIDRVLQKAADLTPHQMKVLGAGSFIYAGLFLTEGIGLWLMKRWAEWFTVIATGSLVPVEIYELYRHPTLIKGLVLVINIAVVAYLVYRIRTERAGLG